MLSHSACAYIGVTVIVTVSFVAVKLLVQTEQKPHHSLL
jgi:hypothetical protein